jgi:hypothetical protein
MLVLRCRVTCQIHLWTAGTGFASAKYGGEAVVKIITRNFHNFQSILLTGWPQAHNADKGVML